MNYENVNRRCRILFLIVITLILCAAMTMKPQAGQKVVKKFKMKIGQTVQLNLEGVSNGIKWKTANTKQIKLTSKGKIKAKKSGLALVKVRYNNVLYIAKITVLSKRTTSKKVKKVTIPLATDPAISKLMLNLASTEGASFEEEDMIFVGDSRFVGMRSVVGGSASWFCEISQGLYWLQNVCAPKLKKVNLKGKAVIFNLGVNDVNNYNAYITYLNKLGKVLRKKGASVFFMTVNPVDENKEAQYGYSVTNSMIRTFDLYLAAGLKNFGLINTYDILLTGAFDTVDGIHYTSSTYSTIYSQVMSTIGA